MITYLGMVDKVVGIGGMKADKVTPLQAYAYANKDVWAGLPLVGTDAAGATDYYPEQIISYNQMSSFVLTPRNSLMRFPVKQGYSSRCTNGNHIQR